MSTPNTPVPPKAKPLNAEDAEPEAPANKTVNLQKRNYDLDPTRFGDWEINGRCVDF